MKEEEKIGDGAEEGDDDSQIDVRGQASRASNIREEEVERVYKKSNEASEEEKVVPMGYDFAVRGEDLIVP